MIKLKQLLFLIMLARYACALVSWNFGAEGCSAANNLNPDNYEDKPMTILDWNSNHCWADAVIPNANDDVHIICGISCGLTGPIAMKISTNVTIKSLKIDISAPTKYFSLQISDFVMMQILLTFNGTTDASSWFSLQIFPSSQLLLHDTCFLDGSVFNGGTITALQNRVSIYVFYVEMCGNNNASLINVDIISIMGKKDSLRLQDERALALKVDDSATRVAAVESRYLKNINACEDTKENTRVFLMSFVPGIFFSGTSATLINSTITVKSDSRIANLMIIFSHLFQELFGVSCDLTANASVVFLNGPLATEVLSIPCSLQSSNVITVGRPLKLQKIANIYGTTAMKSHLIFAIGVFWPNAVHGMLIIQSSLNISNCLMSMKLMTNNVNPNVALIVVNQTHKYNTNLSIDKLEVRRIASSLFSASQNAAAFADIFFYSCAEMIRLGLMTFTLNTIFAWSCFSTMLTQASLQFSGQILKFVDNGNSSALLDPMNMFSVTVLASTSYQSKVIFDGNQLHIEFYRFIMKQGLISIGTNDERHTHNVSFVSFTMESTSSITLLRSAVVTAGVAVIRGVSNIDGVFIAQMLQLEGTSSSSGNGMIFIETNGHLIVKTAQFQPALHANMNATIPNVMRTGGDLSCHSCNIGNSNNQQSTLISTKQILLRDVNLSKSLSLIASNIMIQNVVLEILHADSLNTICSGMSQISDLNFTNVFRVSSGSFLVVTRVTFINYYSLLRITGEFRGNVTYVSGNIDVELQSKSYFAVMELLSSANILVSGVLEISHFTSDCVVSGCKLFGHGTFRSNHFEIKSFSQLLIDLDTVLLFGIFLQQNKSELFVANTSFHCSSVKGSIVGNFTTVNTSIYISQDSHFDLNHASLRLYFSTWSVNGAIVAYESVLDADVASNILLRETSSCHFENSIIGSKHMIISGISSICKNSLFLSDLTMLNNMSVLQCKIIGNVFLEKESVVTILPYTVWGLNVTGMFHILGKIRVLLNDSHKIGYSLCVWANALDLSAISSVTTDGIPRDNVHIELKNDCVQLTHLGCPPGKERTAGGTCELCNSGYHSSQYNSMCEICPKGMFADKNRTACKFCEAGSFFSIEYSSSYCITCI
jgi:hypothetical protein